jgi:hypothetical protein
LLTDAPEIEVKHHDLTDRLILWTLAGHNPSSDTVQNVALEQSLNGARGAYSSPQAGVRDLTPPALKLAGKTDGLVSAGGSA